jgi:hypothetical protein
VKTAVRTPLRSEQAFGARRSEHKGVVSPVNCIGIAIRAAIFLNLSVLALKAKIANSFLALFSVYKFSWKRDEPPGYFVNAPHSLFEPILESQPRHFLEIAPIGREQKGVAGQRDRRNFQITRGNSNPGRLK